MNRKENNMHIFSMNPFAFDTALFVGLRPPKMLGANALA